MSIARSGRSQPIDGVSSTTPVPPCQELRTAKFAIDGIGDLSAGFWYLVMGALEAGRIPHPAVSSWPTEVTAGDDFEGLLYASDLTVDDPKWDGQISFDPPGWRFEDESQVPPGLAFVPADPRGSGWVKIAGKIPPDAVAREYAFDVRCANGYDPNMSGAVTLKLKVTKPSEG